MCKELPYVLTELITRETDQENSRIAISEFRSLVTDNEVDRLRIRDRAHQTHQQRARHSETEAVRSPPGQLVYNKVKIEFKI